MDTREISVGISESGDVKLPAEACDALGVVPGQSVVFVIDDKGVSVKAPALQDDLQSYKPTLEELDEIDRVAAIRGQALMEKVRKGEATWEDFKEMEDIAREEHVGQVIRKMLAE